MEFTGKDYSEVKVAKAIETQTAKLPYYLFLWAAPFLLLVVYNKIVKREVHDQASTSLWPE